MPVYQVTFEMFYPGAEDDIRTAFVLTDSFSQAISMVEARHKKEFESAHVKAVCVMEGCEIITEHSL